MPSVKDNNLVPMPEGLKKPDPPLCIFNLQNEIPWNKENRRMVLKTFWCKKKPGSFDGWSLHIGLKTWSP